MNKRIKEIAEQVEKYISTTNFEGMPEDVMTYDEIFQKKFAQLVAEDCARVLDEDSYIIPELGGYAHDIRTRYGVK
jgi:hypothetical protein